MTQETVSPVGTAPDDAYDVPPGEKELACKFQKEDDDAEKLEKTFREKWDVYRGYVAGTPTNTYTVQTNVIANKLQAVLPYIYARDPEVSVRPSEAVDESSYEAVKKFCSTSQIIVQQEAKRAQQLKRQVKRQVRSAQTVGHGWIKSCMVDDKRTDPYMATRLNTLTDNLAAIDALVAADQGSANDDDMNLRREEILMNMQVVQSGMEVQTAKGTVIDMVRANDIMVAPSVRELIDYTSAPWIRQRIYMPKTVACALYGIKADRLGGATCYRMDGGDNKGTPSKNTDPSRSGDQNTSVDWVCLMERWDKSDGNIYQWFDGCAWWAQPPAPPKYPTIRFYPFYLLGYNFVDDRRYPTSDVGNMTALQDEYSARRSYGRTIRERSKPGLVVNGQAMNAGDVATITASEIGENIVVKSLDPATPLQGVVMQKPVPQFDPRLSDTIDVDRDLEKMSGAQDASSGSVQEAKTATEASILQSGNQAKGSEKTDSLDDMLSEWAHATLEQCVQAYNEQDAIRIAGRGAVWPQMSLQELQTFVACDIRAGSTGKPNTAMEQQVWATLLPQIQQTMDQIAALEAPNIVPGPPIGVDSMGKPQPGPPQTLPPDPGKLALAQCKRALLKETVKRTDDRIDVDQFLPPPPPAMQQTQQDPNAMGVAGGMGGIPTDPQVPHQGPFAVPAPGAGGPQVEEQPGQAMPAGAVAALLHAVQK